MSNWETDFYCHDDRDSFLPGNAIDDAGLMVCGFVVYGLWFMVGGLWFTVCGLMFAVDGMNDV
jgi:hypothetical protein